MVMAGREPRWHDGDGNRAESGRAGDSRRRRSKRRKRKAIVEDGFTYFFCTIYNNNETLTFVS